MKHIENLALKLVQTMAIGCRLMAQGLILILFLAPTAFAGKPISDLTAGEPMPYKNILGAETYVKVTLKKLANPTLMYINYQWLIEHGYDMPDTLDAATEKEILDTLSYALPMKGEKKEQYTDETKDFYADYYGGEYIGYNFGSGRAAALGQIQIKGIGRTPMVPIVQLRTDPSHSDGIATLNEALREVIRSQFTQNELPFGANQVIAVIATESAIVDGNDIPDRRVLIVREPPLRPAHFMANLNRKKYQQEEMKRAGKARKNLVAGDTEKSYERFFQDFTDRLARLAAYSYINRIYIAALTSSNIEISGAPVDFGGVIALNGYQSVTGPGLIYNGAPEGHKKIITELVEAFNSQYSRHPISVSALMTRFESNFKAYKALGFLHLAGFPKEAIDKIRTSQDISNFYIIMSKLAVSGNKVAQPALGGDLVNGGNYDLPRIFKKMADALLLSNENGLNKLDTLDNALKSEIGLPEIRAKLIEAYINIAAACFAELKWQGIKKENFYKYMTLAAEARNRNPLELLVGNPSGQRFYNLITEYNNNDNPTPIRSALMETLSATRRNFYDAKSLTVVLSETFLSQSRQLRTVYNMRTGKIVQDTHSYDVKPAWSRRHPYIPQCGEIIRRLGKP